MSLSWVSVTRQIPLRATVTTFTANAIVYLESVTAFFMSNIVSMTIQTYFSLVRIFQPQVFSYPPRFLTE
jgi:hypothetical protein